MIAILLLRKIGSETAKMQMKSFLPMKLWKMSILNMQQNQVWERTNHSKELLFSEYFWQKRNRGGYSP